MAVYENAEVNSIKKHPDRIAGWEADLGVCHGTEWTHANKKQAGLQTRSGLLPSSGKESAQMAVGSLPVCELR